MLRRFRHRGEVGFVRARIPDRLTPYEGPVSDEMREHHNLRLGHVTRYESVGHLPGYRNAGARLEHAERMPAVVGKKWVICGRVNFPARRQANPEHLSG